jgi:ABC-type amino acid transport system permease subunit
MSTPPPPKRQWSWRSQAFRGLVYQILAIVGLAIAVGYLMSNTFANMRARGIQSGFDFSEVEQRAYFWSTDLFTNGRGFTRLLFYNFSSVSKDNYVKETGRSIRCIKD